MEKYYSAIQEAASRHPKPENTRFTYGTAGFRTKATLLDSVMFRVGLIAALRARHTGQAIGVMITASHNPVADNGVKLVDPKGEMMASAWESLATELANTPNGNEGAQLEKIANETGTSLDRRALVFVARDTRPSSESLFASLKDGLASFGAEVRDYGVLTTPMLHYMVWAYNTQGMAHPTEESYYTMLADAYKSIAGAKPRSLVLDAADGVGGVKTEVFQGYVSGYIDFEIVNGGQGDVSLINESCGAEYVQKERKSPRGVSAAKYPNKPIACYDGDADRLVYMYYDHEGAFQLVDGDKEACLIAKFVQENLSKVKAVYPQCNLSLGVVQTAYANGSSTRFLRHNLGVEVSTVPTGVKHLHHKALDFDVGVYFEANGHGTVVFSEQYRTVLESARSALQGQDSAAVEAVETLLALPRVINQAVGDALSDLLVIEAILGRLGWDMSQWNAMYTDVPSRMSKVRVKDRSVIKTTWDETAVVEPAGMQARIQAVVEGPEFSNGRSFVRPSGTEDIVRVYAEADSQEQADKLALAVCQVVFEMADGLDITL